MQRRDFLGVLGVVRRRRGRRRSGAQSTVRGSAGRRAWLPWAAAPAVEIYRKKFPANSATCPIRRSHSLGLGAAGKLDTPPALVEQMVKASVDVIMTGGYPAAFAAKAGAPNIPVVVIASGDPVATGLVG